jgi:hypothetical protein
MSYNPYRKYCASWWRYWLNIPSDCLAFVKRVRDYAPILWNDNDWDYAAIIALIEFKIKLLAPVVGAGPGAHREDKFAEMAKALVLLRNISDDPDDEWDLHWHAYHNDTTFEECGDKKACSEASMASMKRCERNWHRVWKHFDKYMRGWWN